MSCSYEFKVSTQIDGNLNVLEISPNKNDFNGYPNNKYYNNIDKNYAGKNINFKISTISPITKLFLNSKSRAAIQRSLESDSNNL